MRKMISSILLGMCSLAIYAQTEVLLNVDIGDSIPDINLTDIADRPKAEANLRELSKEKLVVLDFWASWCGSCLAAMPKLDSIAAEYAGEVEIITVTTQPKELVLGFLEKRKQRGLYVHRMPKVFDDKELAVLFPHRVIPHYVWLKDEKVIGFTEEVTREAVDKALTLGSVHLRKKVEKKVEKLNRNKVSLLQFLNNDRVLNIEPLKTYSFMTGYIDRLSPSGGYTHVLNDSIGRTRFTGVNMPLEWLYRVSYGDSRRFINESAIEVKSKNKYFLGKELRGMEYEDWIKKYGVCYETIVQADHDFHPKMIADLKVAFPEFNAYIAKDLDTCLVLEVFSEENVLPWKINKKVNVETPVNEDCKVFQNRNLESVITYFEGFVFTNTKFPLVDNTGYKGYVNMELCGNINTVEGINRVLARYGLRFEKKVFYYDKLIIEDYKVE